MTAVDHELIDGPLVDGVAASEIETDMSAVDWRFLLPSTELGHVALDPAAGPRLRSALAGCATTVSELDGSAQQSHDTVVLVCPTRRQLEVACRAMAPGAALRIEQLPRRGRRRLIEGLVERGLRVTVWWARPGGPDPTCLVGLDGPRSGATVLRTVAGRGRRASGEAAFARCHLARWWSRHVSLVAYPPKDSEGAPTYPVASAGPRSELTGLVTPRFAASRAVIGVMTTHEGDRVARIAKVARLPRDEEALLDEAGALEAFTAAAGGSRAPSEHYVRHHDGRPVLVEAAAAGDPLDRSMVRRDPCRALRAGTAWLDGVPLGPDTVPASDGRAEALLDDPLESIATLSTAHPARRRDHLERAAALLRPLRHSALPQVFEHGDFSPPNLFLGTASPMVAVDWERARPVGFPLHDLTFYLAYLAESTDRPSTPEELVASYRRAVRSGGWARADRDLHADHLGIAPALVQLLELACWTRILARLAEPGRRATASDGHRSEVLWIASIHDAEAGHRR